jgi:hypothetical protein
VASLKLFFSELGATDDDVVATAKLQEEFHRERLQRYEGMLARYADRPDRARRLLPLRLGIELTRAALGFWADVAEHPPEELRP